MKKQAHAVPAARPITVGIDVIVAAVVLLLLVTALLASSAEPTVGLTEIAGKDGDGVVTVYYPSRQEAQTLKRGPFTFQLAWQGAAVRG